jgi:HK97 family phage prohead protease
MPTFILNDETKQNSYGFSVPNAGIDLTRFKDNPVMLDDHVNSTNYVIGRWTNLRIEGSLLKADTEFDMEDENARSISGKVEREFIKGCSMGLFFNSRDFEQQPDGSWVLLKSELAEVSICAIPSNSNALKLFAETGELMSEDQVKLSIQQVKENLNLNHKMKQLVLSVAALQMLGLQNTEDSIALSTSIEKLVGDLKTANDKIASHEAKEQAELKSKSEQLIDGAIQEGKLTADVRENFVQMALSDFASVEKAVSAMPKKANLGSSVTNPTSNGEVKTIEDFQKLSVADQLKFKEEHPESYNQLFK